MSRKRYLTACLLLCVLAVIAVLTLLKQGDPPESYPVKRQIRYGFTLQNKTNRAIKNAIFHTYAPVKQTSTQLCQELIVSRPYELTVDAYGNQPDRC